MENTVGSGKMITTPVISEDGQPIENPSSNGANLGEEQLPDNKTDNVTQDKEVIQWKLTLHQIGKISMNIIIWNPSETFTNKSLFLLLCNII